MTWGAHVEAIVVALCESFGVAFEQAQDSREWLVRRWSV